MINININLVPDMVFLEIYICKLLLSMRYLSTNGSFQHFKNPIPCNCWPLQPHEKVSRWSLQIHKQSLLFAVGVSYSCSKQFLANSPLLGSLWWVLNAAQSSFLGRHTNELIKIIASWYTLFHLKNMSDPSTSIIEFQNTHRDNLSLIFGS